MTNDLVFAEVYKAHGITVLEKMPITDAVGIFYDPTEMPPYDLNGPFSDGIAADTINKMFRLGYEFSTVMIYIDVGVLVGYLNQMLPSPSSAPVPIVVNGSHLILEWSAKLLRNFGFFYSDKKGGFVRTRAPKRNTTTLYTPTTVKLVQHWIMRYGTKTLQQRYKLPSLQFTNNYRDHSNNVVVLLKTHFDTIDAALGDSTTLSELISSILPDDTLGGKGQAIVMMTKELHQWWKDATEVVTVK